MNILGVIGQVKNLTTWQLISLAFYTLGSSATTYSVSHDWKMAAMAGAGFFVAHCHGQLQQSPADCMKAQANANAQVAQVEQAGRLAIASAAHAPGTPEAKALDEYIREMEKK